MPACAIWSSSDTAFYRPKRPPCLKLPMRISVVMPIRNRPRVLQACFDFRGANSIPKFRAAFTSQRTCRGREFGGVQAGFKQWSGEQRSLRVRATFLAVISALLPGTQGCHSGNRLGDFAVALLFLFIAPTTWCVDQFSKYAVPETTGQMNDVRLAI